MRYRMQLNETSYEVICENGALSQVGKYFPLERRVLVLTDQGVPEQYAQVVLEAVHAAGGQGHLFVVQEGEKSKNFAVLEQIERFLMEREFTRADCAIAVGGGMVCDLCGMAAALYMRGIDCYYVPTTVLAAADAAVGGKCAVNLGGVKNAVGVFSQPRGVVYDPQTARTLPKRQVACGLTEALKMAATFDGALFAKICQQEYGASFLEETVHRCAELKGAVVQADERESGLRKVLNFGHTLGHAIEAAAGGALYHGECVALGMLPVAGAGVWEPIAAFMEKWQMPRTLPAPLFEILPFCGHDKKCGGRGLDIITVAYPGSYEIRNMEKEEWETLVYAGAYRFGGRTHE